MPRLGLSAVVLHGSDARTLHLGLGHIESTALPGEAGNVAIAGHRDSFFRPLRNVRVGDDILLETRERRMHYRVSSFRVVNPREVGVIAPTSDAVLTLVTCYPFSFVGEAPDRFVVRATRVDEPPAAVVTAALPASPLPNLPATMPTVEQRTVIADRPTSASDETLVQEAVDRFRQTYNATARAASNRTDGEGPDGAMTFRSCTVALSGRTAAATCPVDGEHGPSSHVWTFRFAKDGDTWTIKSVGTGPGAASQPARRARPTARAVSKRAR